MTSVHPEHLLSVARACRPTPTAAGGLVLASARAGFSQTCRLDGPDRFPVRLAPAQDRMLPVAETPLGLLVRHDAGGNETWQLSLVGTDGGLRPVTTDRRAPHRDTSVAPDGPRAGTAYNPGRPPDWGPAAIDLDSGRREPRPAAGGAWSC